MAIYHFSAKIIGRSKGKSAVASAAYRSGSKLIDFEDGTIKNYKRKTEVAYSSILLPENAPAEFANRETLWNEVQKVEKNSNAQLARDITLALPVELSVADNIKLVREYCQKHFVDEGMVVDINVHNKTGNPHAHVMLTMRAFNEQGKWLPKERKAYALDNEGNKIPVLDSKGNQKIEKKTGRKLWERVSVPTTNWNDQANAERWREAWATAINEKMQCLAVDHRSYERQGKDQVPTIHVGVSATAMEKRGIATEKGNHNRKVAKANASILARKLELQRIAKEVATLQKSEDMVVVPVKQLLAKIPKDTTYTNLYRVYVNDRNAKVSIPIEISQSLASKQPLTQEQTKLLARIAVATRKKQNQREL